MMASRRDVPALVAPAFMQAPTCGCNRAVTVRPARSNSVPRRVAAEPAKWALVRLKPATPVRKRTAHFVHVSDFGNITCFVFGTC